VQFERFSYLAAREFSGQILLSSLSLSLFSNGSRIDSNGEQYRVAIDLSNLILIFFFDEVFSVLDFISDIRWLKSLLKKKT
jgi:hypothetical protein